MMNEFVTSGAIHSVKSIFQKKVERNVIIDPFSCLIKLSLLRFLDSGTKISIYQNRIHFNSPSYIQGFIRFMYGDNREHLHNLYLPIQKCVEWFWDEKNPDITYMFNNAVIGLKMLKFAYNEYATIQHTIDYYIIIIMQKNAHLISKMGLTTLDIEKITNGMLECETNDRNPNDKSIPVKANDKANDRNTNDKPNDKIESQQTSEFNNNSNSNSNNSNKNKTKNKSVNISAVASKLEEDISKDNSKDNSKDLLDTHTNTILHAKDIRDSIVLQKLYDDNKIKELQLKDMHKFLFELWNLREMDIVINLYKEMEIKQKGYERDNIYSNIMSYCSMKENRLFEYIEQHSSIL